MLFVAGQFEQVVSRHRYDTAIVKIKILNILNVPWKKYSTHLGHNFDFSNHKILEKEQNLEKILILEIFEIQTKILLTKGQI